MAIIIEHFSRCPLCGNVLDGLKEYFMTPPLISNVKDPLFIFSDNGIHIDCLNQNPLKEKLFYHIDMNKRFSPSELKCIIDGQIVADPKNLISIGLLTSNENESLSKFNYLVLNRENMTKWSQRQEFISCVERYIQDGKWESLTDFNYLEYILREVKTPNV